MRKFTSALLNYVRQTAAAFIVGLGIGSFLIGPAALALVFPGQYAPRQFPSQQTHYSRHVINIGSTSFSVDQAQNICVFSGLTCSVRIGALPYNAFLVRAYQQIVTGCTGPTACSLALGTSSAAVNVVAAQSILSSGGATALTVVAANAGIAATGNGIAQTGADGGFDLYLTVTYTVAAPTAGTIVVVLEYFSNNDGGCGPVALGATAVAC
jgi:hypothetical protein